MILSRIYFEPGDSSPSWLRSLCDPLLHRKRATSRASERGPTIADGRCLLASGLRYALPIPGGVQPPFLNTLLEFLKPSTLQPLGTEQVSGRIPPSIKPSVIIYEAYEQRSPSTSLEPSLHASVGSMCPGDKVGYISSVTFPSFSTTCNVVLYSFELDMIFKWRYKIASEYPVESRLG